MFSILSEIPSMAVIKPKPKLEEGAQNLGRQQWNRARTLANLVLSRQH